jgi:hypothetical protein
MKWQSKQIYGLILVFLLLVNCPVSASVVNLLATWDMNAESAGVVSEVSGNGRDLNLMNGAYITSGGQGFSGEALYLDYAAGFDGSRAVSTNFWPSDSGSFHVEMKVKPLSFGGSQSTWAQICHISNLVSLQVRGDGFVRFLGYDASNGFTTLLLPKTTLQLNQWNEVAATIDLDGSMQVVWNGNEYNGVLPNGLIQYTGTRTVIFGGTGGTHNFNGLIDEVKVGVMAAIPEPATAALLGLGALGLLNRKHKA